MTGVVWLSYGVVAAFIVLVLIMLYVSIDTKNYQKRQQQIKRDVQEHTAACYRYFIEGDDDSCVIASTNEEFEAIEEIVESYIAYVEDEAILTRIYQYMDTYYSATYRRQLGGNDTTKRINALYQIMDFHIISLLPEVKEMLLKKHITLKECFIGLKIVATLEEESTYKFYVHHKSKLAANQVTMIVNCMTDDRIYDIVDHEHTDIEWLVAALKVMAKRQLAYSSLVVHELLHHDVQIVRDEALQVLSAIGTEKSLMDFEEYFYSEDAESRMLFAKLASQYKLEDVSAYLVVLAQDKSFLVRQAAIHAIAQYPKGQEMFERMLETIDDAYMHDSIHTYLKGGHEHVALD